MIKKKKKRPASQFKKKNLDLKELFVIVIKPKNIINCIFFNEDVSLIDFSKHKLFN